MEREDRRSLGTAYREGLARFTAFARSLVQQDVHPVRLETQFESLRDWPLFHSLEDVRQWFLDRRRRCTMVVEEIPLQSLRGWTRDPATGDIVHESGEFFAVRGVRVSDSRSREVDGWDQPVFVQTGLDGGILGLLRKRFDGIPQYLIEAKAEPG
ncbi:MAG: NDP-hexose 2,3-dehydratase family protein, partial [Deltaproteobacteria bacterium]|nr:NDP-hexose 2,3-dehydratase family protein [Deltaproteobacteria bacterium]